METNLQRWVAVWELVSSVPYTSYMRSMDGFFSFKQNCLLILDIPHQVSVDQELPLRNCERIWDANIEGRLKEAQGQIQGHCVCFLSSKPHWERRIIYISKTTVSWRRCALQDIRGSPSIFGEQSLRTQSRYLNISMHKGN